MNEEQELVTANLILPIVKDLILPKIQAVFKKSEIKNINEQSVEEQLQDYLERRYTKFLTIDTLVFANMQTLLKVLYQPLTISCREGITGEEVNIKIDGYPKDLLPNYARVIIEDTAGMGKSTITKKLFQSIIEQKAGIPVLIELSQIKKKNSILKEIQNQMSQIGKKISQDIILKLINEGDFIFLFDGYDEIALADREFTIRELHSFIEKAGDNYFLITSRPETSLTSFGDFQKFQVNPLQDEEAYELLKKYDTYGYHKIADSLIEKLKESDETLQEYLSNPFLVSLLYKSFEYKKDIPVKKSQFYEQVFDALFEAHDLSKEGYLKREKYSKLHKDDFEEVLRAVAYFSSKANKIEYERNTIIQFIKKAKKQTSNSKFKESDFLKDVLKTVPLFKKEGNNFKWAHKSLQDYFAAKFIWIDAKESRIPILRKIFEDEGNQRFFNVLLLYCELDRKGFEDTILKWILIEFKFFSDSNYNNLSMDRLLIINRLERSFNKNILFLSNNYKGEEVFWNEEEKGMIFSPGADRIINENTDILDTFYDENNLDRFYRCNYIFDTNNVVVTICISDTKKNNTSIIDLILLTNKSLSKEVIVNSEGLENLKNLIEKKIYLLNDDENNPLSSEDNFLIINNMIPSGMDFNRRYFHLDSRKALAKLKELEKNNPEKEKNDLLDW